MAIPGDFFINSPGQYPGHVRCRMRIFKIDNPLHNELGNRRYFNCFANRAFPDLPGCRDLIAGLYVSDRMFRRVTGIATPFYLPMVVLFEVPEQDCPPATGCLAVPDHLVKFLKGFFPVFVRG